MTATMACAPAGHLQPNHEACKGWVYPGDKTWEHPVLCECPDGCGHAGGAATPPRAPWEQR